MDDYCSRPACIEGICVILVKAYTDHLCPLKIRGPDIKLKSVK